MRIMSRLYTRTDRTRSETVLILMNSSGTNERASERMKERFAPFRMLLNTASWYSSRYKRKWNLKIRSRKGMCLEREYNYMTYRYTIIRKSDVVKIIFYNLLLKSSSRGKRKRSRFFFVFIASSKVEN